MEAIKSAGETYGINPSEYQAWVDLCPGDMVDLERCDQKTIDFLVADYAAHREKYVAIARGITGKTGAA